MAKNGCCWGKWTPDASVLSDKMSTLNNDIGLHLFIGHDYEITGSSGIWKLFTISSKQKNLKRSFRLSSTCHAQNIYIPIEDVILPVSSYW